MVSQGKPNAKHAYIKVDCVGNQSVTRLVVNTSLKRKHGNVDNTQSQTAIGEGDSAKGNVQDMEDNETRAKYAKYT
jgi:hypothetical protein